MSFLGKEYTFYNSENFDSFLKVVGVPEEQIKVISSFPTTQKLVKDGDSYTYVVKSTDGLKETTFKSGVEFDDVIGPEKYPIKNKYVVEGNTVTQTVSSEKGVGTFTKEYTDSELVITIKLDKWDGVAKTFYKA